MDEVERAHIQENLPELIQQTFCDDVLLSTLQRQGILHKADVLNITESGNSIKQAKRLYEIVETRANSFESLLSALKTTCQTGAFGILQSLFKSSSFTKHPGKIEYDKRDLLGTGCLFTKVYKGTFGNRQVAVKVINLEYIPEHKALEEVSQLLKCDWHENIVRYYGSQVREDFIQIALELCDTTLTAWVNANSANVAAEAEVEILRQVTRGLAHLHSLNIVHRDLKPDNIMLTNTCPAGFTRVKITDFGLSRCIPDGKSSYTFHTVTGMGTDGWVAPEVLAHFSNRRLQNSPLRMTPAMDVFSLGCVFYFVASAGGHAFGDDTFRRTIYILEGSPAFTVEDIKRAHFPIMLLVNSMIQVEPRRRPRSDSVLSHPFFWTSQQSQQFLFNAADLIKEKTSLCGTIEASLESHRSVILGCDDAISCLELASPKAQIFVKSIMQPTNNSINSLLTIIIASMNQNLEQASDQVKGMFGDSPGAGISYWKYLFPFFIDVAWLSFQSAAGEHSMQAYYKNYFELNLGEADTLVSSYTRFQTNSELNGKLHVEDGIDKDCNPEAHSSDEKSIEELSGRVEECQLQLQPTQPSNVSAPSNMNSYSASGNMGSEDVMSSRCKPISNSNLYDSIGKKFKKYEQFLTWFQHLKKPSIHYMHTALNLDVAEYNSFVLSLDINALKNHFLTKDKLQCLPLHYAIRDLELLPETLQRLKDTSVDFNSCDHFGNSVLMYAIQGGRSRQLLDNLVTLGASMSVSNKIGETPLDYAAKFGNVAACHYLISKNANVGLRALEAAFKCTDERIHEIVAVVSEAIFKTEKKDFVDEVSIFRAINLPKKLFKLSTVKSLIRKGCVFVADTPWEYPFLHLAADQLSKNDFHELLQYLNDNGNNNIFSRVNFKNQTVLHIALQRFDVNEHVLKMLCDAGVDVFTRCTEGFSIFNIAKQHGRSEQCRMDLKQLKEYANNLASKQKVKIQD